MVTKGFGGGSSLDIGLAATAAICGAGAGLALVKSDFYVPYAIQSALKFESENLYVVALSFLITSIIGNIICNVIDRDNRVYITQRGAVISALGSVCLGVGMGMAGSDMLALWVQIGTACEAAMWTVAGAMTAGLTFFMVMDHINDSSKIMDQPYLDKAINKRKNIYPFVAGGFLVLLFTICGVINIDGVTSAPVPKLEDFIPDLRKSDWSPYAVGLVLGLSAFPLRIVYRARLQGYCGFISAICFPVHQICKLVGVDTNSYVKYMGSVESLWVFFMGAGVTAGACLSAFLSNDLDKIKGDDYIFSFIGGFLMMAGSLLAEGDLYSQLLGTADLHVPSAINLACVCLGGFCVGPIVDGINKLIK